jgi:glycosyltransferase involved in cell wall biosynthesis
VKAAIGFRPQQGPWGGGNQFAASLSDHLRRQGHEVSYALDRADLDIILLTEPRRSSATSAFTDSDVWSYLSRVNPRALVVHRINECDERKNTRWVNRRLAVANRCADRTVFISTWLRDLFHGHGYDIAEPSVILNGADRNIFHPGAGPGWQPPGKLRVVTHHWSANLNKGFDVYRRFDALLDQPAFGDMFAFTYIGRVPEGLTFRHTTIEAPLSGPALGEALRRHHIYLTASLNEPAGMHHVEGAMSGLPLLYRSSGALPEYCEGFGLSFDETTIESRLLEMRGRYPELRARMEAYPNDAETMCRAYERLFHDLLARREEYLARRRRNLVGQLTSRASGLLYDRWYGRG